MTHATWLVDVLRDAGLGVVPHDGWERRGHGGFSNLDSVVWHHDASGKGDSPWVCDYMIQNWDRHGAQLWVSRQGVWHVLAAGVAFHAGAVLPGKPGNSRSLGVETDHTTGEDWPDAQLRSLRVGTAAILRRMRRPASALEFHKTICSPPGRKTDPDGLSLPAEQRAVHALMADPPAPADKEFSIMDKDTRAYLDARFGALEGGPRRPDRADTNTAAISLADLLTAIERVEARLTRLEAAK